MIDKLSENTAAKYNAPIVEAVINLDCDLHPNMDFQEAINTAKPVLKSNYPTYQKVDNIEHKMNETREGVQHDISQSGNAMRFFSADKKQIVQFRTKGYSFNRLEPYVSLDDYFEEIKKTWGFYLESVKPVLLKRVNMRYINRFIVPYDGKEKLSLDDFITTMPNQNPMTSLHFAGIFQTIRNICPETGALTQVSVGTQQLTEKGVPVIVDIDVSLHTNLKPTSFLIKGSEIKTLRDLKNRLYNSTLTERCQSLFQQR